MYGSSVVLSGCTPTLCSDELPSLSCATQMIPIQVEMNSTKWKDLITGKGQVFPNANVVRTTLYKYGIAHNFAFKFVKNNTEKIIVKCKVVGCKWYMSAYAMSGQEGTEFMTVRTFKNEHLHYAQDVLVPPHSTRSTLTASIMVDTLRCNIDKTTNEIRSDLYKDYGLRLTYTQAYRGRERALREIHGRGKDSYKCIPWICDRLIETDPDTVAMSEHYDEGDEGCRFKRLFIAYGCSINGFLAGCRKILYIDGCFLTGPYRGTLLSANAYDADNQLFPFAYAIVSGETIDDWSWFMMKIKQIVEGREITIVSDRHHSIITAVHDIFGSERHAFCYRHLKENFTSEFVKMNRGQGRTSGNDKEDAKKLLDAIAYARYEEDYNVAMGKLGLKFPNMALWVMTSGDVERWAMSKFPYKRWDNITTNVAESFNAWIVKERKHNIDVFIHEHREKLAGKMVCCKSAMENWHNGVGPNIESKLIEAINKSGGMNATYYGDHRIVVGVVTYNRVIDITVDLISHTCSCLAWQMSGIPCAHACAAIKLVHGNVYEFVDDCYKLATQQKIYASMMRPVATHDCPHPQSPTVTSMLTETFLKPPTTKRRPGRPKRKRIESQFQDKRSYHCGRCNEAGHTVKTCQNPNPS